MLPASSESAAVGFTTAVKPSRKRYASAATSDVSPVVGGNNAGGFVVVVVVGGNVVVVVGGTVVVVVGGASLVVVGLALEVHAAPRIVTRTPINMIFVLLALISVKPPEHCRCIRALARSTVTGDYALRAASTRSSRY